MVCDSESPGRSLRRIARLFLVTRQAHVGIALLSGFGSANVDKPEGPVITVPKEETQAVKSKDDKKKITNPKTKEERDRMVCTPAIRSVP